MNRLQNKPNLKNFTPRFAMYDYARGNSALEPFLDNLLETTARLGLDGLAIYLEDLAMFLKPSVYRGSIPLDGWKRLDAKARALGLTLLPLLNLYGHNEQTLAHPEFASFRDDAKGTVLDLDSPTVQDEIRRVLDIALQTFSSPLIHIGFDEAFGLGYTAEQRTGKPVDVAFTFQKHLTWAAEEVLRRGRRPMFWADMAGIYYPEIIADLPRELIPVDWFYRVEPEYPTMRRWVENGFDLWIAPTIGYVEHIWPDHEHNEAHVHSVLEAGSKAGAQGIIFTAWEQRAFPFAARLPMLAWQASITQPHKNEAEPSLRQVTTECLRPFHGDEADRFATASLRLGQINQLLPVEARLGNPAVVRKEWYRCNPQATEIHACMQAILEETAPVVRGFPDLELAHSRFSLHAGMLHPDKVSPRQLASSARLLEKTVGENWLNERAREGYEREFKPEWQRLIADIERWPEEETGPCPPYQTDSVRASTILSPSEPTIACLSGLRGRDGRREEEKGQTRVFIWHTDVALHVRFQCLQQLASRGAEKSVDFMLTRDDIVTLCLDFEGKGNGYLWTEANPAGGVFCQWHYQAGVPSQWHPLAGQKSWGTPHPMEGGWGVELSIPYAELGIVAPPPGSSMGLTIGRRRSWNHAPPSIWGGMGWEERDSPLCLSRLLF